MSSESVQGQDASRRLGVWSWLRALLITLVLLVQCISALPARPLDDERLSRPEGERLVAVIERALGVFGVRRDRDAIRRAVIDATATTVRLRGRLLAPFGALFSNLASRQQWGLFLVSRSQCYRMHVELLGPGDRWAAVYRAGELDELGLASWLRYRRLRGIYNPSTRTGPGRQYDGFVTWLAGPLFEARASAREMRVRMERLDYGYAREPARSLGFEHERTRTRGGQR